MDSHDQNENIEKLLSESLAGRVWRGNSKAMANTAASTTIKENRVISTGYQQLDTQLHDGGWPLTTTTELGLLQSGVGELRLLTPALRELQSRQTALGQVANVIWVAPPFLPFAPALIMEHIDIEQLTVVQSRSMQDTLWATEQALLSECCVAVLSWTGRYNLSNRELRRLQLAAEKSNTWNVLLRHSDCLKQASSSGLRLTLKSNTYSQLEINILKQPQGWGGQHCTLSLQPHYENWQRLPAHLLPHQNQDATQPHAASLKTEQLNDNYNIEPSIDNHKIKRRQASVTLLGSLAKLRTVH